MNDDYDILIIFIYYFHSIFYDVFIHFLGMMKLCQDTPCAFLLIPRAGTTGDIKEIPVDRLSDCIVHIVQSKTIGLPSAWAWLRPKDLKASSMSFTWGRPMNVGNEWWFTATFLRFEDSSVASFSVVSDIFRRWRTEFPTFHWGVAFDRYRFGGEMGFDVVDQDRCISFPWEVTKENRLPAGLWPHWLVS